MRRMDNDDEYVMLRLLDFSKRNQVPKHPC